MQPIILGALIALGGVLIANLLQIWLKIRERNWSRTDTIRKDVYDLSKESLTYTTVLYQRADDGIRYRGHDNGREHLDFLTNQMNLSYHKAMAATFNLMACGEPKVSAGAYATHHALLNLHQKWALRAVSPTFLAIDLLDDDRLDAQEHTDILLNMVEARWYERNWAFRRESKARHMLEKARKKQSKDSAPAINASKESSFPGRSPTQHDTGPSLEAFKDQQQTTVVNK